MLIFWLSVFIVSLFILIKGADWLLASAEKMGLAMGMTPFIVGITIVSIGTSLPELISSFVAVSQGLTEFVAANAIGSNVANILLVGGAAAVVGRRLVVTKDLIDLDLPLIAITTSIFAFVAWDGSIVFMEAVFLLLTYVIYVGFTLVYKDDQADKKITKPKITTNDLIMLFIGVFGLSLGSKYLIDSVIELSTILKIAPGVITITAVAIGTSAPELVVSIKAALRRQSEVALGNIFGSNIFNILVVVGLPGLFSDLALDNKTLWIGLPVLGITTILFIISGISRRIHIQEGALFLVMYAIFIAKLFELF